MNRAIFQTLGFSSILCASLVMLSPVDDEAGPYQLASFLNRSSFVTVNLARSKIREELVPAIFNVEPTPGGMLGASDLVGLSATWFFVRNAAAEIELLQTDFDRGFGPGSPDRDSVRVRLLGRF